MTDNIYSILLNATRMRLVQALSANQHRTATQLCEILPDVPRTTLYRHIGILIDAGIISVIDEKKVRGSVERTLALNTQALTTHNTAENIPQQAFSFLMNTYAKFEKRFNASCISPAKDKVFFNNTVMMMDDLEFDMFLSELQALLIKYQLDTAQGRKPRDISIICAPAEGGIDDE